MIEEIIKTIQEFEHNEINDICKILYNKYHNVTGNCLNCEYFQHSKEEQKLECKRIDKEFDRLLEVFDELKTTSRFSNPEKRQLLQQEREDLLKKLHLEIDYPLFGKGVLEIKKVIYEKDYRDDKRKEIF